LISWLMVGIGFPNLLHQALVQKRAPKYREMAGEFKKGATYAQLEHRQ
jgi:hypothetical protein